MALPSGLRAIKFQAKVAERYTSKSFQLKLPLYKFKSNNGKKILVVLDKPSNEDVTSASRLLLDNQKSGEVFRNIMRHVLPQHERNPAELLVCNYYDCRIKHSEQGEEEEATRQKHRLLFRKRLDEIVKTFEPTHILLMGRDVSQDIYGPMLRKRAPELDDPSRVLGRFIKIEYNGKKIPTMVTFSLGMVSNETHVMSKDLASFPNLIGHTVSHIDTTLYGKNRYSIDMRHFAPVAIDTIEKFDEFYEKLLAAKIVSCDTETKNLNRIDNLINTIQFAFNGQTGYYIPLFHPKTPFNGEELKYILKKLSWWFTYGTCRYMIFVNGKFDVMRIKIAFKLKFFKHRIYDIQAAEFCLDENRIFRNNIGIPPYSLDQMSLEYGTFTYFDGKGMNKSERVDTSSVPVKRLGEYGCKDVVIPFQIHEFQLAEAKRRGSQYRLFLRVIVEQISDMIHCFVNMEINGLPIDRMYLMKTMSPDSDFRKLMDKNDQELKNSNAVQQANDIIVRKKGIPQRTLLGGSSGNKSGPWAFDISKPGSQQALFYEVLKLPALEQRKDGGGKVNKVFQKTYEDVPEVKLFTKYQKLTKLYNAFIVGFYKKLSTEADMKIDSCLRPNFQYFIVVTGRAAASKPSLQQVPTHSDYAKFVKRQFICEEGELYLKADYSAHEVRNWGAIALDDVIAEAFRTGLLKRWEYRLVKDLTEELQKEWGEILFSMDIHRVNYKFFYGRPVNKDPIIGKAERQSVKSTVFGVMYGKGANSLALEIKSEVEEARKLIELLFEKFKAGGEWVKMVQRVGRETCRATSPIGRVRHLWGYLHWSSEVHAMMDRRGPNSIIQGMSSDEAFKGGRNLQKMIWNMLEKQKQPFSFKARNTVHDSSENTALAIDIPLSAYLLEHAYTTRVHSEYRRIFGMRFPVDLEMEMNIGPNLRDIPDWDYRSENTIKLIEDGLKWSNEELGHKVNISKVMKGVEHNALLIESIRNKEIKRAMKKVEFGASEEMIINRENILDLGLKFALSRN